MATIAHDEAIDISELPNIHLAKSMQARDLRLLKGEGSAEYKKAALAREIAHLEKILKRRPRCWSNEKCLASAGGSMIIAMACHNVDTVLDDRFQKVFDEVGRRYR